MAHHQVYDESSALVDDEGSAIASGQQERVKPKRRMSRATSVSSLSSPVGANSTPDHTGAASTAAQAASSSSSTMISSLRPYPPGRLYLAPRDQVDAKRQLTRGGDGEPVFMGMKLKYVSLITLALQNATLTIVMHYSRINVAPGHSYSAATAVLVNELTKGTVSLLIALRRIDDELQALPPSARPSSSVITTDEKTLAYPPVSPVRTTKPDSSERDTKQHGLASLPANVSSLRQSPLHALLNCDWRARFAQVRKEVFSPDCWKLSIPALLYVIQNNLQYVAASNLDVATFQVTYQMKILTTAAFSVILLGKKLTRGKWLALLFLALGVGIVQIQSSGGGSSASSTVSSGHTGMSPLKGFSAVSAACFTSGLAGVYFELLLKGSKADLWIRNVQLSLFSLIPAIIPVFFGSGSTHQPAAQGLLGHILAPFHDFTMWAWATVFVQVAGGLVTAVVIKHADNILKGFATSLSIVLSFFVSVFFFGSTITPSFLIGSTTVLASTWLYNQPDKTEPLSSKKVRDSKSADAATLPRGSYPSSPISPNAPIIGNSFQKPRASAPSSLISLTSFFTQALTPSPSAVPSRSSTPVPPASAPAYGYHIDERGVPSRNGSPGEDGGRGEPQALSSAYFSGQQPASVPASGRARLSIVTGSS